MRLHPLILAIALALGSASGWAQYVLGQTLSGSVAFGPDRSITLPEGEWVVGMHFRQRLDEAWDVVILSNRLSFAPVQFLVLRVAAGNAGLRDLACDKPDPLALQNHSYNNRQVVNLQQCSRVLALGPSFDAWRETADAAGALWPGVLGNIPRPGWGAAEAAVLVQTRLGKPGERAIAIDAIVRTGLLGVASDSLRTAFQAQASGVSNVALQVWTKQLVDANADSFFAKTAASCETLEEVNRQVALQNDGGLLDISRALDFDAPKRWAGDPEGAEAQALAGWAYRNGTGVKRDERHAWDLFSRSAAQGSARGKNGLAWLYADGAGVARDEARAVALFSQLGDQGDFDSSSDLGLMVRDGRGLAPSAQKAFSLFEYAAQNGSAKGQFQLANAYRLGLGIAKDEVRSALWLTRAARQGLEEARTALALLPQDLQESANLRLVGDTVAPAAVALVSPQDPLADAKRKQDQEQMALAAKRRQEADRLFAQMQAQLQEEASAAAAKKKLEDERVAEAQRKQEQDRLAAASKRQQEEQEQMAAAKKKVEDERVAESQRKQEQARQAAELKRQQEEQEQLAAAKKKVEDERVAVELQRKQDAEAKALAAQQKKDEALAALQAAKATAPVYANRKALVIGNDNYQFVNKLVNARADARAIGKSLEGLGYQVSMQLDLDEKHMKKALRTFRESIQGGDEVLFYYAGHGTQIGATNYLLPTDIQGENEAQVKDEAIQLQRILDDMSEQKAKFTLVVVDACRDNPFKLAGRAIGGRGLAPTSAATGQMVIFSAGTGQQALDNLGPADKNPNGVFTRTFLKEIDKPGVSVDRVLRNVRSQVIALARSVGHEQTPALYDQADGDFYLKPAK